MIVDCREKLVARDDLLWTDEIVDLRWLAGVSHDFVELPPLCHFFEDRLDCGLCFGKIVGCDRQNRVESRLFLFLSERLCHALESLGEHFSF